MVQVSTCRAAFGRLAMVYFKRNGERKLAAHQLVSTLSFGRTFSPHTHLQPCAMAHEREERGARERSLAAGGVTMRGLWQGLFRSPANR